MTDHKLLRAAGNYIAVNGFSPEYRNTKRSKHCGCFIHAFDTLSFSLNMGAALTGRSFDYAKAIAWLRDIVGPSLMTASLRAGGWGEGPESTDDAAAACYIAADIAEIEYELRVKKKSAP